MAVKRTAKWNATYKSTMAWQKKARAKDRRFAAKGADVSDISPVKSTRDIQNMSLHELERYRHSLNEYVDRSNRLVSLGTPGEYATTNELSSIKRDVNRVNRRRAQVRKQLIGAQKSESDNVAFRFQEEQERRAAGMVGRGAGSPYAKVMFNALPKTRTALGVRKAAISRMLGQNVEETAAAHRQSVMGMLDQLGQDELKRKVEYMSTDSLEYAIEALGLFEELASIYVPERDIERGISTRADIDAIINDDETKRTLNRFERILQQSEGVSFSSRLSPAVSGRKYRTNRF